ncbi:MAG: helix-turn-helix transcriptional regulator [Bifidobacteriaceae bacterium]|jgi:transcriptional regulator with XRE-family HTH domain|nr:helix-turn-helix transcriptional regulator [Bifidobacteriaceae bacterium]
MGNALPDTAAEVRDFLRVRRSRLRPADIGLPTFGGTRKVPGLRREEVALVAGISVEYYTRMERGDLTGVSDSVLAAIAEALRLGTSEAAYLVALARGQDSRPNPFPNAVDAFPRDKILQLLDAITAPAWIQNHAFDILAANPMARSVHQGMFASPAQPPNPIRFLFLDPNAPEYSLSFEEQTIRLSALTRMLSARRRSDPAVTRLITELREGSAEFRAQWLTHDVAGRLNAIVGVRHPTVGPLTLDFEVLPFPHHADVLLNVQTAPAGSPTAARLARLATQIADDDVARLT